MKRPLLLLPLLALAAVFLCGCCLLPIPIGYTHGPSVGGTVLEQGTDKPVVGATITIHTVPYSEWGKCDDRMTTTGPDGQFYVPEDWDIHFGFWVGAPTSGTCLPFAIRNPVSYWPYCVTIEADGYETGTWIWSSRSTPDEFPRDHVFRIGVVDHEQSEGSGTSEPEGPHAESAETAEPKPHTEGAE